MEKVTAIIVLGVNGLASLGVIGFTAWAVTKGQSVSDLSIAITAAAGIGGSSIGGIAGVVTGFAVDKLKAAKKIPKVE